MFPRSLSALGMALILSGSSALAADGFSLRDTPGQSLDVLRDGKILARYMYAHDPSTAARRDETYKPYLHVFDPEGAAPITKGAGGTFPHHRGIFAGWMKIVVNGRSFDRWHMKGGDQVHEKFANQIADKGHASFTSIVRWEGATPAETILEEERTITFQAAAEPGYAKIDVLSKLKAVAGETLLDGDPEHSGLQFRPAEEMDRASTTYLFPGERADPHADRDYPWFGETYTLRGKRCSVVFFNHPANPKGARISAYRDYGRFGAFWETTIAAGATQEFRARFLVLSGELPSAEAIQKEWNSFAGANEPTAKTTTRPAERAAAPAPIVPPPPAAAKGPTRAGGGPENPVLQFKLPPPPVLTAQEALQRLQVAPGFKVELVAAEPLIEAPVALSWDDQGRLYVVEMRGYMPDMEGTGEDQPTGRVSRLEDLNGDGTMDRATVFADKLVLPRAVMAMGDGALIGEPPNLTFYRDTDGDGVADQKELVSERFGTRDGQPEHMANSPTWQLDNWISVSNHHSRYRFRHGQFTTEPAISSGQWGRTQDDWGRAFYNYNSDFLRTDLIASAFYARNPRLVATSAVNFQVIRDQTVWPAAPNPGVNRGYSGILRDDGTLKACTATCGPAIYRGDLFPPEFHGNAFIPEPSANLVKRVVLGETDGQLTGRNAAEGTEFLRSTDERFRPVNAYTGPDGALYIVDLARGVVQHKGFLTYYLAANIRDRELERPLTLGRIYRIVPEGAKPVPVKLPSESAQIVPLLTHANGWVRDTAQRVLVERDDASVIPAVRALASDGANPQSRLHALWTLEGMEALQPADLQTRLQDPDEKLRAAAVRLAGPTLAPELLRLVRDPSAAVRLQLAFSFSGMQQPGVDDALLGLLESANTPTIAEGVVSGLSGRELEFLETLLARVPGDEAWLAKSQIVPLLATCVWKERRAPRVARLLELVAAHPARSAAEKLMLTALAGKSSAKEPAANPIRLSAAPVGLAALKARAFPGDLLARIEQQITWPGKQGSAAEVLALTPEQQARFEKGKGYYAVVCAACHQPSGAGLAGLAPPLVDSEWVLGVPDRAIRILLGGLTGPIEVAGTKWQLEMPALPHMTDDEVAGVLTYLRREWEHRGTPVTPEEVAVVRAAMMGRTKAWTAEELQRPITVASPVPN